MTDKPSNVTAATKLFFSVYICYCYDLLQWISCLTLSSSSDLGFCCWLAISERFRGSACFYIAIQSSTLQMVLKVKNNKSRFFC